MPTKGLGEKAESLIKKTANKGGLTDEELQKFIADQLSTAAQFASSGKNNPARKIRDALSKHFKVDYQNLSEDMQSLVDSGGGDNALIPDKLTQDLIASKHGENILTAAMLEENLEGRDNALDLWEGREEDFLNDPLVQQLQSSASDLLENPDIIDDDLMQQMLAGSDATLSRAYQGNQANLAGQIGGLNMDPNDPLAQSLAAQGRFSALQGQAQNTLGLKTQAAQLNRQGLENAMRLQMGTASFMQGGINEIIGAQSALHTFQPMNQSGMFAAGVNQMNNLEAPDTMSPWAQAGIGVGSSLLNFAGDYGTQKLFGIGDKTNV